MTGDTWTPLRRTDDLPSASALLLTILGEFVMPGGVPVWTSTVVDALGLLGVEEGAARQALARSSTRDLVAPERVGRTTRWSLTDRGRRILSEGAARIYSFGACTPEWDGRWLLVLASVPEPNRHLRARLRTRMTWLGFGALAPGTWVSPWAEHEGEAISILTELGLGDGAITWLGRPGALGGIEKRASEIWNLSAIADDYDDFLSTAAADKPASAPQSFASLVRLVHDWRHFPGSDPGLPSELLAPGWPAPAAAEMFATCRAQWSPQAWEYWRSVSS